MTRIVRIATTAALGLGLALGALVGFTTVGASAVADRDCGDFPSQKAAQLFFLNHNPAADPHGLDADGDWVVCESNPGPYYYGSDPTPGSGPKPAPVPPKKVVIRVVKVLDGQLIKVREGKKRPVVVHLMGVTIPDGSCEAKAAVKDLRSWVKPGMAVRAYHAKKGANRDSDGHLWRLLERVKGGYDIGGSQIDTGFAEVERALKFPLKAKYLRWEAKAIAEGKGYHGTC